MICDDDHDHDHDHDHHHDHDGMEMYGTEAWYMWWYNCVLKIDLLWEAADTLAVIPGILICFSIYWQHEISILLPYHSALNVPAPLRPYSSALVIFARPSWPKPHEMHVILLSHASVNVPCKKYQRVLHADFEWLDNEVWYCWWKKSCISGDVKIPVNLGINYLSTGAGFLPWYWRNGGWLLQFRRRPLMLTHVASWCYVLSTRAILWVWFWLSCFSSNKTQFVLFGDAFGDVQDLPSWELTYPTAKVLLKMVFPFIGGISPFPQVGYLSSFSGRV